MTGDDAIALPVGMASGGRLEGQRGVVYSARPGGVDAALLGKRSIGIAGSGNLAVFTFRAFADRASVRFSLVQDGPVDLSVYSVDGRRVRTLVRGQLSAGSHVYEWDRSNDQGTRMGPGLYLLRLTTAQGRFTRKLSVVR